jgi:C1A family cysteine protease
LGAVAGFSGWSSGGGPLGRKEVGLGYLPDLPDVRDKGASHLSDHIGTQAGASSFLLGTKTGLPERINLGDQGMMPAVEDQGKLNSCTANAVISLVEYLIKESGTDELDMSRLFLYWTTRRLLGWTGDAGAYIRTTIKAMALFGVPPESDWPYLAELLDRDPDAYLYAYAQNFKSLKYARLDESGMRGDDTLAAVKMTIADGFPIVFGFPVYRSIESMGADHIIPLPGASQDRLVGGHAVLAVGYDDGIQCPNQDGTGALIIRNSWGPAWGDMGYGYLPYDYVRKEMALDFWTIFHQDWINPR